MKALALTTIMIIAISVFASLSIVTNILEKYNDCKGHMFSETPQCNMVELGQNLSAGMIILGMLFIVSTGSVYFLISAITKTKKTQYGYFG